MISKIKETVRTNYLTTIRSSLSNREAIRETDYDLLKFHKYTQTERGGRSKPFPQAILDQNPRRTWRISRRFNETTCNIREKERNRPTWSHDDKCHWETPSTVSNSNGRLCLEGKYPFLSLKPLDILNFDIKETYRTIHHNTTSHASEACPENELKQNLTANPHSD